MNATQAMQYIHNTNRFGSKLGLENITDLMARLGNPHKKLTFIHVAGTNGKGSTVAFLSGILIEAGYKTGIYTSPFIKRFNERIVVNCNEITDEEIAELTTFVKTKADEMVSEGKNHPTEFEIVTAIALLHYERQGCEIVVLEVGLGGRLDSTNVIDCPVLSVITSIGFDHMEHLGGTLAQIAFEKAGIIKTGGDALVYEREGEAAAVFERVCRERGAKLWKADFSGLSLESFSQKGQRFSVNGHAGLRISLLGEHQIKNAALVVKAIEILRGKGYHISDQALRQGLAKARWAGRFEVVHNAPDVVVDGAHNEQGVQMLVRNIQLYFPGRKIIFVAGVLKDKNYQKMMELALPLAKAFVTLTPDSPRALDAALLAECINQQKGGPSFSGAFPFESVGGALDHSLFLADADDVICVFGSLYFIGDVRAYFGVF